MVASSPKRSRGTKRKRAVLQQHLPYVPQPPHQLHPHHAHTVQHPYPHYQHSPLSIPQAAPQPRQLACMPDHLPVPDAYEVYVLPWGRYAAGYYAEPYEVVYDHGYPMQLEPALPISAPMQMETVPHELEVPLELEEQIFEPFEDSFVTPRRPSPTQDAVPIPPEPAVAGPIPSPATPTPAPKLKSRRRPPPAALPFGPLSQTLGPAFEAPLLTPRDVEMAIEHWSSDPSYADEDEHVFLALVNLDPDAGRDVSPEVEAEASELDLESFGEIELGRYINFDYLPQTPSKSFALLPPKTPSTPVRPPPSAPLPPSPKRGRSHSHCGAMLWTVGSVCR